MGVFTRVDEGKSNPLPAKYSAHRSLTAAAVRVNIRDTAQVEQMVRRRNNAKWQEDAWAYYDMIGELKYAFRLFSNVLSRVRLVPGYVVDENAAPNVLQDCDEMDEFSKQAVYRAMRRAFGATAQAEILRKATINLLVVGECYLVQLPKVFGVREEEQWRILSISELMTKDKRHYFKSARDQQQKDWELLPESTFVGRIWSEHAQYSDEADSAMRALIGDCDDLFLYTRAARASARSRLNAGALFVPSGMSVSTDSPTDFPDDIPYDPDIPTEAEDPEEDLFEEELIDAMTAPIGDESAASSVVPFLIRGEREDGAAIKHIKFERPFDPQIAQRAERALERILQGIDLPKDIVTGLANIKYSNAVQIEESLYTAHIEPVVLFLCDAFRVVYLVPALEAEGLDPDIIRNIVVWYDPSAVMTAPDKSNAANLGFDKYNLSGAAWRRYNGFSEADAPDGNEIAQRMAISRGQLNDGITEQLLRTIMPEILDAARSQALAQSPTGPMSPGLQEALGGEPVPGAQPPPEPGETAPAAAPSTTGPDGLPPIVSGGSNDSTTVSGT